MKIISQPRKLDTFYVYLSLFFIFFILSLGLGYATLNRYDPGTIIGFADFRYYAEIVKNGPTFFTDEQIGIKTRLLAPWIGHLAYNIIPNIGTYNAVSVAMLIVNSAFTSLSVVFIINLTYRFLDDIDVALISGFIFFTNFFITNSYLAGSVDAAYGCMFLLMFYIIINDKWVLLPAMMIIGCLTKEVFLPVGSAIILCILVQITLANGYLPWKKFLLALTTVLTGSATIIILNYLVYGAISSPWELLPTDNVNIEQFIFDLRDVIKSISINVFRFFLILGMITLGAIYSLRYFPQWFIAGNLGALIMTVSLAIHLTVVGELSGADYARFMFSPMALLLSGACAVTLSKLKNHI